MREIRKEEGRRGGGGGKSERTEYYRGEKGHYYDEELGRNSLAGKLAATKLCLLLLVVYSQNPVPACMYVIVG